MARMTPLEFAQRYFALDTFIFEQSLNDNDTASPPAYVPPQGWNQLRVDNYRLGASPWDEKFWTENIAAHFREPVTVRIKTIWGDEVDPNTLDVLIASTRRALGEPSLIQTVRGVGYALKRKESAQP